MRKHLGSGEVAGGVALCMLGAIRSPFAALEPNSGFVESVMSRESSTARFKYRTTASHQDPRPSPLTMSTFFFLILLVFP